MKYVIVPNLLQGYSLVKYSEWKKNTILQAHGYVAIGTIKELIKKGYLEVER